MKGMTRCAVILAAFLVVAGALSKAEAEGGVANLGAGNSSCGTWTTESNERGVVFHVNSNWLFGYITSFNTWGPYATQPGIKDISKGIDADGLVGWIDNWCRANPLENISAAATALILELAKRQGN